MLERDLGAMETTTWGEIQVGHIVRDKNLRMHTVLEADQALVRLQAGHPTRTIAIMQRPAADRPVDIYVPSEAEALELLDAELGARRIREFEERERTLLRQLTWRMEPLPSRATDIRDHLDMIHGVNVDDVLRKWRGTEAKPAGKGQRAAALAELKQAHQEFHDDPGMWPMVKPHVHTLDPKEN